MTGKEVYKIWAPIGIKWVDWVRPVPFVGIDRPSKLHELIDYSIPSINYLKECSKDTAIIIDIEGINSIQEGIALAKLGYRPIPIFNGTNPTPGSRSTTNNAIIEPLLVWGALELKTIKLKEDAPPAFLLDKNRLNRYKINRSIFDNSWDIYPQDIPTPEYLLENGITKIIIRGDLLEKDLSKVLYKFQKRNIKILFTNGYEEPKRIRIKKPKIEEI